MAKKDKDISPEIACLMCGDSPKKEKRRSTCYRWIYDDKTTIGCVVNTAFNKKYIYPDLLKNKAEWNKYIKNILNKAIEKGEIRLDKKSQLKLPIGIKKNIVYDNLLVSCKLNENHFSAFQKMTQPEANDEQRLPVLQLISLILSSYLMRRIIKIRKDLDFYPVDKNDMVALHIEVSDYENAFYYLRKIADSIIITTDTDYDTFFRFHTPAVIPTKQQQTIKDSAWLSIAHYKSYKWPAPYRDTAVIFDGRHLAAKDIENFSKLNPWCSCIVYAKKVKFPYGYIVNIKGKSVSTMDLDWDVQRVHALVEAYITKIPSLFSGNAEQFQSVWRQAGSYVGQYGDTIRSKKLSVADRFKLRIMLSAMISFLTFTQKACSVPATIMEEFQRSVLNILLPGCVCAPDIPSEPEKSPKEKFEQFLQTMLTLDNLKHFYPIPNQNGVVWPEQKENGDEVWGYIKYYDWSGDDTSTACLVLLRDQLLKLVQELEPHMVGFSNVLTAIRKELPEYIHKTPNVKFKRTESGTTNQETAYRLNISKLPIHDEAKQALLSITLKE